MRRTKIICTLGPASRSPEAVRALIAAGMNVARLNFSHGAFAEHEETIRIIREEAARVDAPIAILQDLPGPKIRIGEIRSGVVTLDRGHDFRLTSRPVDGSEREVTLPNDEVRAAVKEGDRLFLSDGSIQLRVVSTDAIDIVTRVEVGGPLSSHKGVAVPGVRLNISAITPADLEAMAFGVRQGVDWIAASFVRSADDIRQLRAHGDALGSTIPLVAKIEKHEAVADIDAIIAEADGIMVARGDLGVDLNIWEVPVVQKTIIRRCNAAGKPVITATQMLESMIQNPRPTRAEVTDVANAILDGTDCVMLSAETAVGRYPVETVTMMDEIARSAEATFDHAGALRVRLQEQSKSVSDAIGAATVVIAQNLDVPAIITATSSGSTARLVSRCRPKSPIIGITSNAETWRRLALTWGVTPLMAPPADTMECAVENGLAAARDAGLIGAGDCVVVTGGLPVGEPGHTNLIRVAEVAAG